VRKITTAPGTSISFDKPFHLGFIATVSIGRKAARGGAWLHPATTVTVAHASIT
jgi:hypothetical protein